MHFRSGFSILIIYHDYRSPVAPAMPPAVSASEFPSAGIAACDIFGATVRTYIAAVLEGIQLFKAFHPFLTAVHTSDGAYILRKIAALDMNRFPVYQTVCDFFPCGR